MTHSWPEVLAALVAGRDLDAAQTSWAMTEVLSGEATPAQIAALVVALRMLAAYAVTPLMNLQFVWMVILGALFFQEYPAPGNWLGVAIVVGTGLFLVWDQFAPGGTARPRLPLIPQGRRLRSDP